MRPSAGRRNAVQMPSEPNLPLHQPHDKLFKVAFGNPEAAAALFRAYLPEALTRHLDFRAAVLEPGSYIDEEFRASESDLLFRVPYREKDALVYFLFEHQRREDPWLALRLLRYELNIWETWRKRHPESSSLPAIIPVVLAQNEKRWDLEPRFSALFALTGEEREDFGHYVTDFAFQLIQLAEIPFEKIVGTPMGVMTLRVLKAEQSRALLSSAVWDEPLLKLLSTEARGMLYRYMAVAADVDTESFKAKIQQLRDIQTREHAMSVAEQLRREGMEEGLIKGLQKGREEGLGEGLERGECIGQIRILQDLLGREQTPTSFLASRPVEELRALRDELRKALGS